MKLKQYRLSSNSTLFLKIVLPTVWMVFFVLLMVVMFLVEPEDNPFMTNPFVRYGILFGFLFIFFIAYRTILRLKRVDADKDHIFVSNYFKTYRYKLKDIKTIEEVDFGLFLVLSIVLHQEGKFGRNIPFLLNRPTFDDFIQSHPECGEYFVAK